MLLHISDYPTLEPPLGLAYPAGVLEREGYEVRILDAFALGFTNVRRRGDFIRVGLDRGDIKREIENYKPDMVGISAAFTSTAPMAHESAKIVKEINFSTPVVFGGAHASANTKKVLVDRNVDVVVRGEGEVTFLEFVKEFEKGGDIYKVHGTWSRKDNSIIQNPPRPFITDLDTIPFPARHLLPMNIYLRKYLFGTDYSLRQPRTGMITSRGCPFNCIFCSIHTVWGRRDWRARSPTNVVDEIEFLMERYGVREIAFFDDNLTLNKKRMLNICREIVKRNLDIKWCTPNGVAIWTLDKELLDAMKRSGCWKLTFGIESGSLKTQRYIRKIIDLKKAKDVISYCNRIGLWTHGLFIIGFPYETLDSIRATIKYAIDAHLNFANFYIATPYPGTDLYKDFSNEGLLQSEDLCQNPYWSVLVAAYRTKFFTKDQLQNLLNEAYSRFIKSRMKKPLKALMKIRSLDDLKFLVKILRIAPRTLTTLSKQRHVQYFFSARCPSKIEH